jgi:hypothetical protein
VFVKLKFVKDSTGDILTVISIVLEVVIVGDGIMLTDILDDTDDDKLAILVNEGDNDTLLDKEI